MKKGPETFYLDPNTVVVKEGRFREEFDRDALEKLKASIISQGQINPITIYWEENKAILVAGERRLRSCRELSIDVMVIERDNLTKEMELQIELEENLARADLTAQEELRAKRALHNLLAERAKKETPEKEWTIQDTADMLGVSRASLSQDLNLASLEELIPEWGEARNKSEIAKLKRRRKQNIDNSLKLLEAKGKLGNNYKINLDEEDKTIGKKSPEDFKKTLVKKYQEQIIEGDGFKLLDKQKDNSVDIFFFDPPWGIELHKKDLTKMEKYEDDEDSFIIGLPKWLELIYRKMSKNSHLYFFFSITKFAMVSQELVKVGFQVNNRPIIWNKPGIRTTRHPDTWPGASYEPIFFARKGNKKLMQAKGDVITLDPLRGNAKLGHPSAKPWSLYLDLLERSAAPGDMIIDPTCGIGGAFVAAEKMFDLHLRWRGFEKSRQFHTAALTNLINNIRNDR